MEPKEEDMDKNKLIKLLSQLIQEICDRPESSLITENRKIKLRQYQRMELNENKLNVIDVTIEF